MWLPSPTQIKIAIVLAVLAGMFYFGWSAKEWKVAQDQLAAERAARATERSLQGGMNQAAVRHFENQQDQSRRAEANAQQWEAKAKQNGAALAACRVDVELQRVLNDATVSGAAEHSARADASATRADQAQLSERTALDHLGICRRNYAEVCVPNAVQLRDLQRACSELINAHNSAIGSPREPASGR